MSASLKWKLVAGFVLAFLAGGAVGGFIAFHQTRGWHPEFGRHPHAFTERMRIRMKSQLDLTPEQVAKVDPILNHATEELQKIRADTGAKVRQVANETNQALAPLLTDTQRVKLKELQEQSHHGEGRPHGPHRHRGESPPGNGTDGSDD
jgi:Spy/CpxP family protein refolding chaperone